MLREIKEEIGIDVEIIKNVHSVGDHDHCCFFYICKTISGHKLKINHDELKNFEWFKKDELNQKYIPEDVRAMTLKGFEILNK